MRLEQSLESEDAKFANLIEQTLQLFHRFVIPLYTPDQHKRPIQIGSGFIVSANGRQILISAAHVLRELEHRELFYYIAPNTIRLLVGSLVLGKAAEGAEDKIDIAGLILGDEYLPPYTEVEKHAMPLDYLVAHHLPRTGKHYAVVGFPSSKSKTNPLDKTVQALPYAHHVASIPDSDYSHYGFSSKFHLLLPLDLKKNYDLKGQPVHFPRPQGMSGAPVWVIYEEPPYLVHRAFPVVGVAIEYRKQGKIMVASDISAVKELIRAVV